MEYLTSQNHYPGALSDHAAALLRTIAATGVWQPDYSDMTRLQIVALEQLIRAGYIQPAAYGQYRARGVDTFGERSYPLVALRQQQDARNRELNTLYSGQDQLVALWEAKATIIDFRLRPWRLSLVNEAHNQLELDIEAARAEWQAAS